MNHLFTHFQALVSVGGLEAVLQGYQRMTVLPYMETKAHPIRDKSKLSSTVYQNRTRPCYDRAFKGSQRLGRPHHGSKKTRNVESVSMFLYLKTDQYSHRGYAPRRPVFPLWLSTQKTRILTVAKHLTLQNC